MIWQRVRSTALSLGALLIILMACSDGGRHGAPEAAEPQAPAGAEGPADSGAAAVGIKSIALDSATRAAAKEFWTEERMRQAKPLEPPTVTEEELQRLLLAPATGESVERTIEGSPGPKGTANAAASTTTGTPTQADVNSIPFSSGGKLFVTETNGDLFTCTAEFVGSNRVLMTAAHCVTDGKGSWYANLNFVRGYDLGGGQTIGLGCISVPPAYFEHGDKGYDYAFIYTDEDSEGGWLGFKTDVPFSSWSSIGYPEADGDGESMYQVNGTKGTVGARTVEMLGGSMGAGSTGGAWIADIQSNKTETGNYAIGLNAYRTTSANEFSPRFNEETYDLLLQVMDNECNQE
ncbi:MAG: hypothetical protein KDD47_06245 [Acidobacteria bacterium]|nr:hypothetical protein [Acidobacteriota bacterium]